MHRLFILPFWNNLYDNDGPYKTTNRHMVEFARKPGQEGVAGLGKKQLRIIPNMLLLFHLKRKDKLKKDFNMRISNG